MYGDHNFQRGDDIKVEPLFLAAMIVCALWPEARKKHNMLFVSSVSVLKVQTVQVHIREGDSDVRLLQEA